MAGMQHAWQANHAVGRHAWQANHAVGRHAWRPLSRGARLKGPAPGKLKLRLPMPRNAARKKPEESRPQP